MGRRVANDPGAQQSPRHAMVHNVFLQRGVSLSWLRPHPSWIGRGVPNDQIGQNCAGASDLDPRGRHRAPCTRSGRLKKRAAPVERMLARVFRESSARVRFNAFLKDMNVGVSATDDRRIEVLAQDLPCFGGSQVAVDVTFRSALRCSGEPQHNAADVNGATLAQARTDKETTYLELVASNRCRLVVVVPLETGGRWSEEADNDHF